MHTYRIQSGDVSLVAATAKTLLQLITPSTRRAEARTLELSFSSITSTNPPVLVELLLQTTAGTVTAHTPSPVDQADPAALCTAGIAATAEPTASTVLWSTRVTPVGGTAIIPFPRDEQIRLAVSTRLGVRITSTDALSGVRAELCYQE